MKKEVKIGIYAIVIILAAWAGIRFLSGADIFGRNRTYTAHYEQVNGLQEAAAVVLRGVKIGQVTDIEINTEKGGVDVRMSVDSHYDIPVNSQAMMFSAGLMGGKSIEIVLGDAAEMLKNAMQKAVSEGTGKSLASNPARIAGKTGTAETGWVKDGRSLVHGWFCGFFPYDSPRYAMAVLAEDGGSGAVSAAPIFGQIAEEIIKIYPIG